MKKQLILLWLLAASMFGCRMHRERETITNEEKTISITKTIIPGDVSTMSGQVIDKESGEPLMGVKVALSKDDKLVSGAITDMDGMFQIDGLLSGSYKIKVTSVEHGIIYGDLEIRHGFAYKLDARFSMEPNRIEKPVIYLYPTQRTEVSVRLEYKGILKHTYPAYPENGWIVTADPDGTLWDAKGQEYYALFWEGTPMSPLIPSDGFVVPGTETAAFLEEKLAYLGLNRREANEFIMYWLPRLENNPYNLIHFAGQPYEEQAKLLISPEPETIIRVMMLTRPLQSQIEFPAQDLSTLKKVRSGFTVVEWGGSVLSTEPY